jgi:hypothetical protein
MALKEKILIDLGTKGNFDKYMTYLRDVKQSVKYWIEKYTAMRKTMRVQNCKLWQKRMSVK